jgi:hypothetical protein
MPRNTAHGGQQSLVADATLAQLPFHHHTALSRE